jgi:hypothetical protein
MGIYWVAGLTAQVPIIKLAQTHKHDNTEQIHKNKILDKKKPCGSSENNNVKKYWDKNTKLWETSVSWLEKATN